MPGGKFNVKYLNKLFVLGHEGAQYQYMYNDPRPSPGTFNEFLLDTKFIYVYI